MSTGGRFVSVSGECYERLRVFCFEHNVSMPVLLDRLFADFDESAAIAEAERTTDVTPLHGQGNPRLSQSVQVTWSEEIADLVYDSLPDMSYDRARTRTSSPIRPREASAALEAALVRMLDTYDAVAARAGHCAICRVRSRNAKPFVPMLAGDGVVAVCRTCVAERRRLDGVRRSA